ncbi:MAG: hypothetical protein IPH97_04505 [Ignavibacteriales bacterium]|nr:hypothetical protein [Ignavibacteriales bacterium]
MSKIFVLNPAIKKMIFCCERFKGRWETESDYAMNIRIMKLKADQIIDFNFPIRCFIMAPYLPNDKHIQFFPIFYCPYCGTDLLKNIMMKNLLMKMVKLLELNSYLIIFEKHFPTTPLYFK